MAGQTKADTDAKVRRVRAALRRAVQDGGGITIRGVARAAGVDHVFIQRREDLRSEILDLRSDLLAARKTGMRREDVRWNQCNVMLSDRERAFVDRARGSEPMARYNRQAVLEKAARDLGYDIEDLDVRRASPRQRNHSERAAEEQGQ